MPTDFVDDGTDLPAVKHDHTPLGGGDDATEYIAADDYNAIRRAANGIRSWIIDPAKLVPAGRVVTAGTGLTGGGALSSGITLGLGTTGVTPGPYTSADLTVDAQGRVTAIANGAGGGGGVPTSRTLTAGTGLTGGGDLTANRSFAIATTGVTAASYTNANITVGADGRLTAASNGSGGGGGGIPTSRTLTGTSPVLIDGIASADLSADRTISLDISALSALLGFRLGGFGDASDGTAVMDGVSAVVGCTLAGGTYKATRPLYFQNLTINSGITFQPDGYDINVRTLLTNNGVYDFGSGGDAVGTTGGVASWTGVRLLPTARNGQNGSAGGGNSGLSGLNCPRGFASGSVSNGTGGTFGGVNPTPGTNGGPGQGGGGGGGGQNPGIGNGSDGGSGGGNTIAPANGGDIHDLQSATRAKDLIGSSYTCGSSGGSGGAGNPTGSGGGSGASGAWGVLRAFSFAGAGVYRCKGGNGAAGVGGGGGGGSGSPGGFVVIQTGSSSPPTVDVSGGTGGAGGVGTSGGVNGAAGGNGGVGLYLVFN